MSDKNEGLNERIAHKKRIKRMKTALLWILFTWMLALMLISVTLIVKVQSLQEQIDIITENTIRSQQVEQKENQSGNTSQGKQYGMVLKKAGSDALQPEDDGKNTQGADGNADASDKNASDKGSKSVSDRDVADADGKAASDSDVSDKAAQNADGKAVPDNDAANKDDKKAADKKSDLKVYLTFDDGPSENTEKILDILDKYQVKATFFVTGREDKESLERYQDIVSRGHTIGMHSYSHKYDSIYRSRKAFTKDLEKIQACIKKATGQTCMLYRFPGGSSNCVSRLSMGEFIRILNKKGITYFDWNAECGDASAYQYSAKEMVDNVMEDVVKYHTSVVLMHDAKDKPDTVKALPKIIRRLQAIDAQILPIDGDTKAVQHVLAENVE